MSTDYLSTNVGCPVKFIQHFLFLFNIVCCEISELVAASQSYYIILTIFLSESEMVRWSKARGAGGKVSKSCKFTSSLACKTEISVRWGRDRICLRYCMKIYFLHFRHDWTATIPKMARSVSSCSYNFIAVPVVHQLNSSACDDSLWCLAIKKCIHNYHLI